MNINSYYPPGGSFGHQPLSLHDNAAHQLSNGFHHGVGAAAGFMSPTHYSSRPICPGYDLPGSQSKAARFVADGDDQLMRSGTADVNGGTSTRDHQTAAAYASLGDPAPHHPHVHHQLHHHPHHQQQQQVSRWAMTVGDSGQTSTSPPPALMQTSAFNHAIQSGSHHLSRPATADTSPPTVSCQSPHSAGTGFNSSGHIPFYPWMGVVGKQFSLPFG